MEFINIKMALNIQEAGEMIYSTEWGYKIGLIIRHTKGCILQVKSMEKEPINGVMAANTQATGRIIRLAVRVFIDGSTEGDMRVNGKIITCKAMECILGKMEGVIKANIKRIKSMGTESTPGPTVEDMKGGGIKLSNSV